MHDSDREQEESGIFKVAFVLLGIIFAAVVLFVMAAVTGFIAAIILWG